ncbi:hypothetical protein [Shimazuella kribbensis]|uniref:hypothetical protein n=1 Tax=Shimazuella kribbensis TaxID=139808 RepID=UPI00040623C6|nr:hypothetical protein [Shimazuella kribbensis]
MGISLKFIGIIATTGALLFGGISFPQTTKAQPNCYAKGSVNVSSSKASEDISFQANGDFQPKIDLTFYGDKNGSADATINQPDGLMVGYKSFNYTTNKQTKTLVLSDKKLKKGSYKLYFTNGGDRTLHITSYCIYG